MLSSSICRLPSLLIPKVRYFGGQQRQLARFGSLVNEARTTASALHVMKSTSEAWTRGAVYVSLLTVFLLGGKRVQDVSHSALKCIWLSYMAVVKLLLSGLVVGLGFCVVVSASFVTCVL